MDNFLKNIKTPLILSAATFVVTLLAISFWIASPTSEVGAGAVEESLGETTSPTLKTPEEISEFIAQQIIDSIRDCPRTHELHALFSDGTSESVYVPPFSEMIESVDGDESILLREFAAMILIALDNGAIEFHFMHSEEREFGD